MKEPKIIDLSYTIKSDMMIHPGLERPVFQWVKRANAEGSNLTKFSMIAHTSTHVDAPKHFLDNGACIDEIPLNRLFGKAKLFRYKKELTGQEITIDDILATGFQLEEDMIFILETGIAKFKESRKFHEVYPAPSEEVLNWLIRRKIKAYMTDVANVDFVKTTARPNHHCLLGAGIPIVECLRNLHLLPENKPFLIGAFPLKLLKRDGAPCRAVAFPDIGGF